MSEPTTARVTVETPVCPQCGKTSMITVQADAYDRWRGGELIQRCFPLMRCEEREMLITGIHPDCWNRIFAK